MEKIGLDFYLRDNVVLIARELIGKYIFTNINNQITSGIIVETEAYEGITDRASHAWNNRRTNRTEIMYANGGITYVYLCYGIHSLLNIVTNLQNIPHAILIRAIKPSDGIDIMSNRRKRKIKATEIISGPGNVAQALGVTTKLSGMSLIGNVIWLEDHHLVVPDDKILVTPRIGIDYAGDDALLPYRFVLNDFNLNVY
jgi:DNA-3-methyladenine glycosylase